MKCRPCGLEMQSTFRPRTLDTAHACGSCGRGVVTRDPGVYPKPSASVPSPEVFKPLPEEMGWSQEETPDYEASTPKRLLRKPCEGCGVAFQPKVSVQRSCTPCAVAGRVARSRVLMQRLRAERRIA